MPATPEEQVRQFEVAYGPFQPGSVARQIRDDHRQAGIPKTCWECLKGYEPAVLRDDDGRVRHPGRGKYFCSVECFWAWESERHVFYEWRGDRPPVTTEELRAEMQSALDELRAIMGAQQ